MNTTTKAHQVADVAEAYKEKTIASIAEQYGKPVADAVDEIAGALCLASGIIQIGADGEILAKLMLSDLTSRLVARLARHVEKSTGISAEERATVIDLAKELHTAIMCMNPDESE
jgi:hypothetical protein